MKIRFKKLVPGAQAPRKAHDTDEECVAALGVVASTIPPALRRHGIEHHRQRLACSGTARGRLTQEQQAWLRANYPRFSAKTCAIYLGLKPCSIGAIARRLGDIPTANVQPPACK